MPANLGIFAPLDPEKAKHRGVIYTIAPSPKDSPRIWVGTDDGLIHVTADGGRSWKNVTPKALTPWSKVSLIAASHSDPAAAYAAVNRIRLDDLRPHIYRTRDGGATWQETVRGIPENVVVNAVREDPLRRGLLFAGTERGVYVSFDDGDEWQSLRLNLPATSVRDLVVHGDDVVVGTHGRSFWILDDITPLRQMAPEVAAADAYLYRPQTAIRVRRSQWPDTPLPPEEPAGKNPPDGAIIDYVLKGRSSQPVTLEIADASGRLVRRYSSADRPEAIDPELNVPTYWVRPTPILSAEPGMHRFVWDLHSPPPDVLEHEYPISAIPGDTPRHPLGPAALPGAYTVRLSAFGRAWTAPLAVRMDPRVTTPVE
ncbi:MAG TPA: glycoside hydrolase, partial [Thermoanaerobaculia bacterium]|nr:glycoside hydrolase [Thermoanaerobaculia bacterium]